MTSRPKRERVVLYLYGELTAEEEEAFRAEVERDPELRALLAREEQLDHRYPAGRTPRLPEGLLQESRLLLAAALRQETRLGLLPRLRHWFRPLPSPLAWAGGVLAILLIGVLLGRTALRPGPSSVVGLIRPDDLQIVSLRVTPVGVGTNQVRLVFDALSWVQVEGTLQDQAVQAVLAAALRRGDLDPGTRLRTVALLGTRDASTQVREALVHALLQDENPGVRLKAVEALKALATYDHVREALRQALLHDLNPGVRLEAIEALAEFRDPATLRALEQKTKSDENVYIRTEAARLRRGARDAASGPL